MRPMVFRKAIPPICSWRPMALSGSHAVPGSRVCRQGRSGSRSTGTRRGPSYPRIRPAGYGFPSATEAIPLPARPGTARLPRYARPIAPAT
ncbi:hypothetical protein [Lysobacter gummosus]|uniref:hypothetical protein n=1 Tax=Lysobacter gummosus TaxID=262324 RepID=UPI003639F52D